MKNTIRKIKVTSKKEFIQLSILNKDVLDIGCLGNENISDFHDFVIQNSNYTLGVDINKNLIQSANPEWALEYGNAENYLSNKKYDVILASELIEHLSNPGLFLEKCFQNLKDDGIVIITTPNSYGIHYTLDLFKGKKLVNPEHCCWFDINTLTELGKRYELNVKEYLFTDMSRNILKKVLINYIPEFSDTITLLSRLKK